METKRCNRCHEVKPKTDFRRITRRADGYSFWGAYCIPCDKIKSSEYQKAHRARSTERVKEWAARNPFKAKLVAMERASRYRWKKAGLYTETVRYQEVLDRDGWLCYLCGQKVVVCNLSFDHVIPKFRSGPHTFDNIRVTHIRCNDSKGGKLATEARWMGSFYAGDPQWCLHKDCPEHDPPS